MNLDEVDPLPSCIVNQVGQRYSDRRRVSKPQADAGPKDATAAQIRRSLDQFERTVRRAINGIRNQ